MPLILTKVLPALVFPASLTCLLCLLTAILAFRRKARSAGWMALATGLLLYAACSPVVAHYLLRGLERNYPQPETYPRATAIVLLGGAMIPDLPPRKFPETNAFGSRVLQAARLWRSHSAPRMVVTGGAIPFITGYSNDEAGLYAKLLTELFDVPDSAILRVAASQNTFDDARMTRELFDRMALPRDILLVTSAAHMSRAVALFQKQGFTVHPAPADYHAGVAPPDKLFALFPAEWAFNETANALHEYVGFVAYKLMGRL